jgi:proline iminopeptidase
MITETLPINGIDLFTRTIGSGPDVIVLHGGPGAHHDYLLPQFDDLARRRRLRYYDQRGGGRSPVGRDVPVDWPEHVSDLRALIQHWRVAPATLLGYSWGGLLALLFALEHPDQVGRLALVSPAAASAGGREAFEREFSRRMRLPAIQDERAAVQQSGLRERDPEAYRRRIFSLSVAGYFRDSSRAYDLTPFRVTGRTQDAVWRSLGRYDLRPRLPTVSVPALVAHGRHDPIPLETARETARLLGATLHVFEESGHVPYVEQRDEFVRVLDDFLPAAR